MKPFDGFTCGMGIGGWMTNYKRIRFLPENLRLIITKGDKEHFESYLTRQDVQNIRKAGFDHIRIAFDQVVVEEHDQPFSYREDMLRLLDRFIGWCETEKIGLVLNLHHAIGCYCDFAEASSLLEDQSLQTRFIRLWTMLEGRYHDKPEIVFEILNEVTTTDAQKWNDLADRAICALRAMNPLRKIILGSAQWNSPDKLRELRLYDDENIAYTFHFYGPGVFTHQRTTINQQNYLYNRAMEYPGDIEKYRDFERFCGRDAHVYDKYDRMDERYIRDALKGAAEFRQRHPDKVLWAGEFGTIRNAKTEYRENWMRDMIRFLKENKIPYCVWNYLSTPYDCNKFSLVDDDRREFVSAELKNICLGRV